MASPLLTILSQHKDKSPDEIVAKLQTPAGFFECEDLSEEDYNRLRSEVVVFYTSNAHCWEGGRDTPQRPTEARLSTNWPTYQDFQAGYWHGWWVIVYDQYREGMPCPT